MCTHTYIYLPPFPTVKHVAKNHPTHTPKPHPPPREHPPNTFLPVFKEKKPPPGEKPPPKGTPPPPPGCVRHATLDCKSIQPCPHLNSLAAVIQLKTSEYYLH